MANRNVPQPFEIDKIRFRDCFTEPSLRHFVVLITGWVKRGHPLKGPVSRGKISSLQGARLFPC